MGDSLRAGSSGLNTCRCTAYRSRTRVHPALDADCASVGTRSEPQELRLVDRRQDRNHRRIHATFAARNHTALAARRWLAPSRTGCQSEQCVRRQAPVRGRKRCMGSPSSVWAHSSSKPGRGAHSARMRSISKVPDGSNPLGVVSPTAASSGSLRMMTLRRPRNDLPVN